MSYPLPLSIYNGKVKELKAQKKLREKLEKENRLGDSLNIKISAEDKKNKLFYSTFKKLKKLYKDFKFDFITSADEILITQYCDLVNEIEMLRQKKKLTTDIKELVEINKMLNRDRDMLLKISRELYLTPVVRVKTQAQIAKDIKGDKEEEIAKEVFE